MPSRDREMREAKKSEGLCLYPGCGNKALQPAWDYCEKHPRPVDVFGRRRGKPRDLNRERQ